MGQIPRSTERITSIFLKFLWNFMSYYSIIFSFFSSPSFLLCPAQTPLSFLCCQHATTPPSLLPGSDSTSPFFFLSPAASGRHRPPFFFCRWCLVQAARDPIYSTAPLFFAVQPLASTDPHFLLTIYELGPGLQSLTSGRGKKQFPRVITESHRPRCNNDIAISNATTTINAIRYGNSVHVSDSYRRQHITFKIAAKPLQTDTDRYCGQLMSLGTRDRPIHGTIADLLRRTV